MVRWRARRVAHGPADGSIEMELANSQALREHLRALGNLQDQSVGHVQTWRWDGPEAGRWGWKETWMTRVEIGPLKGWCNPVPVYGFTDGPLSGAVVLEKAPC